MTRRIFSILLTLALCLTLLPTAALAEDTATHANHCVCGATHSAVGDHTAAAIPESGWTAVDSTGDLPTESGHYYLTADVTTGSGKWTIPENTSMVLCLNGKTLTANNGRADAYDTIMIEGTLTITDCSAAGTGKITGNNNGARSCKAIQVAATGTLNLYGGSITDINVGGGSGGGVHNRGTFNMYGGAITNNKAKKGGGVLNWGAPDTEAIFNMYGGTISGNTSTDTAYTDGNEIYNELHYRDGTGGEPGVMNAYGGTVAGTVKNLESTITTAAGYAGTSFNGTVTNSSGSTISGGNFNGTVANSGTISGGTLNGAVTGSGTVADSVTQWYDSEAAELEISSEAELRGFASVVNNGTNFSGKTVKLTADITLTGEWTPIGNGKRDGSGFSGNSFTGTFDGNNKTISGLKITSCGEAEDALGLFGVGNGGTVKNLKLADVSISTENDKNTGAAIGLMVNGATAEKITVSGTVKGADGVGGIVGRMTVSGTIRDCVNAAAVEATEAGKGCAGGIVGKAYYTGTDKAMTISGCKNTGAITGKYEAGGIAGFSAANVADCANEADISAGNTAGGIVGEQTNYGTISGNTNSGKVSNLTTSAGNCFGGIVGWLRYQNNTTSYPLTATIKVSDNINSGMVAAPKAALGAGGIVGTAYNQATVTGNENKAASITGGCFVAGVLGGAQHESDNLSLEGETIQVYNNVSSTAAASITGQLDTGTLYVHPYMYNNDATAFREVNNSAAWAAKIGTAKYATLAAAVDAAEAADTIQLLTDITLAETLTVPTGKTAALDLSDRIIAAAEGATITGTLTVQGSGKVHSSLKSSVTMAEGYCLSDTADENGCYAIAEHDTSRTSAITTAPSYNREGVRTYYCAHCGEAVATASIRRLTPSSPAHDVDIKSGAGGSVSVNLDEAREGSIVTITAAPDKGNMLESLTVTDEDGNELEVHSIGGNKYTFIMPGGEVTIRASFTGDAPVGFVDVPADKYFYDAVMWAVRSGITGGVDATHFAPHASCTRGQLVTFLWRAAGEPAAESGEGFHDVKTGSAFYQAILWAAENEIVGGYDDGAFRPNAAVSRQQVAAILWRFAKAQGMDVSVGEDTNILSYNDAFDVSEYAIPALQWACGANVMGGNDGNLLPYSACTRAQIVTMLYRLLAE